MSGRRARLALVHHLNQYLITDGYKDRQGISTITEGYAAALRLHARYGVPASVHLSGTLIEALAWHRPEFLRDLRDMVRDGLLTLVGGTYAENVMPLFPHEFNVRQLQEGLGTYERHLRCRPADIDVCWVPERVWDTDKLAPVLTDTRLPNTGYRYVILDDRTLFPVHGRYAGSARETFDGPGPAAVEPCTARKIRPPDVCRIAGGLGLRAVPVSGPLRYAVPPSRPEAWERLESLVADAAADGNLLCYADDLERTSGVGGWDAAAMRDYETLLRWLGAEGNVDVATLPAALSAYDDATAPPLVDREVEVGTYFELARTWHAGEDYTGWEGSDQWSSARRHFATAERVVSAVHPDALQDGLGRLAERHLMASSYETAWHDDLDGVRRPAAWAEAVAGHARACLPIVAAAEWFADHRPPTATIVDIDDDGRDEVVIANSHVYVVLAPSWGARAVYLFQRAPRGGAMLVGNPTDDWNLQRELNRYLDCPANHPGAFADHGHEHDACDVVHVSAGSWGALAVLEDVDPSSSWHGARKSFLLAADARTVLVRYDVPGQAAPVCVDTCLSPDYLTLLLNGRTGIRRWSRGPARGVANGNVSAWQATTPGESVEWAAADRAEVGHGFMVRARSRQPRFHLILGSGSVAREVSRIPAGCRLLDSIRLPHPAGRGLRR